VIPSQANFVFFGGIGDQAGLWSRLVESSVLVRDVGVAGHLRVTAGTAEETEAFLAAITTLTKETVA
jgi:histidinol-phosphate aminotransferase